MTKTPEGRGRLAAVGLWLTGAVAGLVLAAAGAQAADFPRWRGANSNGSAGETILPLATSWDDVRVAWVSEVKSPHPWNYSVVRGMTQWPRTVLGNGGFCQPSVWDGKVYVGFYRPSGAEHKPADADKWQKSGLPGYTLLHADSVIVCMDAATGRTLWEAVWPQSEANLIEPYGGHNNLCVAGGRAYALGNTGLLYCADAKTGEKLWSSPVGPSHKLWERWDGKDMDPAARNPVEPRGGSLDTTTYNTCPVVADGVVVTGEWSRGGGLVGFDAVTGKELWRNPRAGGGLVPPLRWVHDKKEYLIIGGGELQCLEPKTGKLLWTGAPLGNTGNDAATPALEGDYLVAHGSRPKGVPAGKREGWVCYKLSPTGAEKAWALGEAYLGTSYIAPVIHRGCAWVVFARAEGAKGLSDCDTGNGKSGVACVELATGKVLSEIGGLPMNPVCPGPAAMGDLLIYQGPVSVWFINIADPKAPKFLGPAPQPSAICCSATAADGLVYFRSAERLVVCLDVRQPAARPAAARHDDPASALVRLDLDGGLHDGKTPTFYLRGKGGAFPQSWAIVPSDPRHPDVLEPGTLRLTGGELAGRVKMLTANTFYDYILRAALKDGKIEGEYEDCYRGVPVKNEVTGTMRARAGKNAKLSLSWSRNWFNGSGQVNEHTMYVTVADGKVTEVELIPRRGPAKNNENFNPTILKHDLRYDGRKLTGTLTLDMKCRQAIPGRYTWTFDVEPLNNLLRGTVAIVHESGKTATWECWGDASVPDTEPGVPVSAVYWLDLKNSVRFENDTSGAVATRVYLTTDGGKGVSASATVRGSGGLQRADVSEVRVAGNRLKGRLQVWMKGDGYLIRTEAHSVYDLDLEVKGPEATGTYDGTFDVREPRRGKITGTYANE